MNNDEIQSMIVKLGLAIFTGLATKYGIDQNALMTALTSVAGLATFSYGVYSHWNMVKVPETATVIPSPPVTK